MSLQALRDSIPDFGKDTRLNLGAVLTEEGAPGLGLNQIWGIALASAYALQDDRVTQVIETESESILSPSEKTAAKSAASIMAMNNIYYRFVHLASDKEYAKLAAKLRMNVIARPGIEKVDFELYALAISALNGCGMCINAHIHEIEKAGVSKEAIQSSVRIASVLNAVKQSLSIQSPKQLLENAS